MDWYLDVKIWVEDNLCSSCLLIQETKTTEIQRILTTLARYVQNTWKRHQDTVFWIDIDLGIIKEWLMFYQTRSNAIILQGALPASCIVRAERLKNGEKSMNGNICLLVHHRRSLWGTISIGPEGMMNWALQLNIDQSENSFTSHLEKQFNLVLPSQPNP